MTNETIGECKCIYPVIKNRILYTFNSAIALEDEVINYYTSKKDEKEKEIHSSIKKNFEDVRVRVTNTPDCVEPTSN